MTRFAAFLLLLLSALGAPSPANAATRSFTITSFDRVRVDGPYSVRLSTGRAPFAQATGSPAALDGISIQVEGRTLTIRRNPSAWGGYPGQALEPVTITAGTYDLSSASLNGAGTLAIDKVKGLTFDLSAQGSGRAEIRDVQADRLVISLAGSVTSVVAGKALRFTGIVRGASSLDASGLSTKDAVLSAEGPAQLWAKVSDTLRVDASGTSQVQISGRPACTAKAMGSSTIVGCR